MSGKLVTARSISCTETIESINQNIYKYSYMHERNFLKANPILRTTWKNYGRNLRLQNNNNINYVQIREVQNRTDTGKEQLVKQEMLNRDPTHNLTLFYEAQREEETPGVWGRQKGWRGRVGEKRQERLRPWAVLFLFRSLTCLWVLWGWNTPGQQTVGRSASCWSICWTCGKIEIHIRFI